MRRTALLLLLFAAILAGSVEVSAEAVRIGAIYSLTGVAAPANAPSVRGVRLAVKELNKEGGIGGRRVDLRMYDNGSTPIGSKCAAERAVEEEVCALVGAAWSSHSLAAARVAQRAGVPMVSNASTHAALTRTGPYIFRVCFTDAFQGETMADFARRDLSASSAAVLVDIRSDYSMGLAEEFVRCFRTSGGEVKHRLAYKQKEENFRAALLKIKNDPPDVLFIPGHTESGRIALEAQKMGIRAVPLGGDGWGTEGPLVDPLGRLKEAYFSDHWSPELDTPQSRAFVKRYGKTISTAALAYDAVMLIADAVRRADSTGRDEIRRALEATRNFEGVTGDIHFDRNGDPEKSAVIIKVSNGQARFFKSVTP